MAQNGNGADPSAVAELWILISEAELHSRQASQAKSDAAMAAAQTAATIMRDNDLPTPNVKGHSLAIEAKLQVAACSAAKGDVGAATAQYQECECLPGWLPRCQ